MSAEKVLQRKASTVVIPPLKNSPKLAENIELSRSDSATKTLIITPHTPQGENPNNILKDKIKTEINSKRQLKDSSIILNDESV